MSLASRRGRTTEPSCGSFFVSNLAYSVLHVRTQNVFRAWVSILVALVVFLRPTRANQEAFWYFLAIEQKSWILCLDGPKLSALPRTRQNNKRYPVVHVYKGPASVFLQREPTSHQLSKIVCDRRCLRTENKKHLYVTPG